MSNKRKNILVWILTWAGLLVAILYSPVGSPDLYKPSNKITKNGTASFNGADIENSPASSINFESGNDYNELNVPDYSSEGSSALSSGNYSSTASSNESQSSSGGTSYSASESQSYQNLKNGSSGSGVSGSNFSSGRSGGSDGSSAVRMNSAGVTTLSTDMTALSTRQGVAYAANQGGTDPGGDPVANTRIPVPDGWAFLLVLAASYGFVKKKFIKA